MALSGTIVWEIRSAGSDNNGGGYKTGASGTDWSQQNSAQYALTAIATSGAGATFLTVSAANDMVGNIAHVVSGTNFTAGFYEITSVSVGVSVTCDANVCTGVGSSGVINIGGALATIGKIGSASANQGAVAGNTLWVKGSFSLGATDTIACSGSSTSPIKISGYNSTRGDGYLGRTNSNGPLILTNMPTVAYASTFRLNNTGAFLLLETLSITGIFSTGSQGPVTLGANSAAKSCSLVNSSTGASANGIYLLGAQSLALDCDAALSGSTGGSGGGAAIVAAGANARVRFGRATCVSSGAFGVALATTGTSVSNCTVYNCGGVGISVLVTTWTGSIESNTVVGCGSHGINVIAALATLGFISNNLLTDNGGYGIQLNNANVGCVLMYNRYRDNVSGTVNLGTDWTSATNYGAVTSGTGVSDYVASGSQNYNLLVTSPATSAGIPILTSIGALQRSQTSSGGGIKTHPGMTGGILG